MKNINWKGGCDILVVTWEIIFALMTKLFPQHCASGNTIPRQSTKVWYCILFQSIYEQWCIMCIVISRNIVSWEPEGRYQYSKMFHWEPEGRYHCTKSVVIVPFLFSNIFVVIVPFWLLTDDMCFALQRGTWLENTVEPHYKEVGYITKPSCNFAGPTSLYFFVFLPWYNEKPVINNKVIFMVPKVLVITRFHCTCGWCLEEHNWIKAKV